MELRDFLRFLDKKLSPILLKVIYFSDAAVSLLTARPEPKIFDATKVKRILIIKIVGLGDTVLMLPSLKRLRKHFPNAKIFILVSPFSDGIISDQSFIDGSLNYDVLGQHKGLGGFFAMISELKEYDFDLCIDYEQNHRLTTLISYLVGIKKRVGFYNDKIRRDFLLTDKVLLKADRHMIENFDALLNPLGIMDKSLILEPIDCSEAEKNFIVRWKKEKNIDEHGLLVGIHVGSSERAASRRWAKEGFASIADKLKEEFNATIVFTGSANERPLIEDVVKLMKTTPFIATELTIKQFVALLGSLDLFISNDTGPMHMGAAMDVATIGLFGPQTPACYGPFGSKHVSIYKGIACSPCIKIHREQIPNCKNPKCMKAISVSDVWVVVKAALENINPTAGFPGL
jgi:ADP-heptose:LPS heptosyltransferase